jgi:prevent-host-death family protein
MHTVSIEEAAAHLPELIAEAQKGGEVLITQNDQPVARLAPPPASWATRVASVQPARWPGIGLYKGRITLAPDFDEPLEEFGTYME